MSESSAGSNATPEEPSAEEPATDEPTADEPEVFVNRAARRAKGKKSSAPEVFDKGQRPGGRGAVQAPRQYGTRRSG